MAPILTSLALLLAASPLATAHFGVLYPPWRADTLTNTSGTGYSQWTYPCGGVSTDASTPRTDWPITGGSLNLKLNHPWTYLVVNLGLGANATNFNLTFTPDFLNATGNGTLCLSKLNMPVNVTEGVLGSIQVITPNERGQSLYNCVDVRFTANATVLPPDQCKSNNVTFYAVTQPANASPSNGSNATGGSKPSAGASTTANMVALTTIVGLAISFCVGMSL